MLAKPFLAAGLYGLAGLLCISGLGFAVLAGYLQFVALDRVLYFGTPDRVYASAYLMPCAYACFSAAATLLAVLCGMGVRRVLSLLSPGLESHL